MIEAFMVGNGEEEISMNNDVQEEVSMDKSLGSKGVETFPHQF
mgnify:FL=1